MNEKQKLVAQEKFRTELEAFKASDDEVKIYSNNLNKIERSILHDLADELDLLHFSEGDRKKKRVSFLFFSVSHFFLAT